MAPVSQEPKPSQLTRTVRIATPQGKRCAPRAAETHCARLCQKSRRALVTESVPGAVPSLPAPVSSAGPGLLLDSRCPRDCVAPGPCLSTGPGLLSSAQWLRGLTIQETSVAVACLTGLPSGGQNHRCGWIWASGNVSENRTLMNTGLRRSGRRQHSVRRSCSLLGGAAWAQAAATYFLCKDLSECCKKNE